VIRLKHLCKKFGNRTAVDDLSLEIAAGEIYGLLGHNGAGKSTAIGMMLGQIWPTSGEVILCGHEVTTHRHEALLKVGAIFESPAFYDYLSGFRNLEILSSYSAPTERSRILEVINWVGLTGREHSKVKTYSHGMRARLALAQALLPQPELLILDEPGNGLDPQGIHEMRQTILRLRCELGLTILLSSHLLNEVEQLCTRIAVLREGKLVFEGLVGQNNSHQQWVRLRVDDFAASIQGLTQAQLISDHRDGKLVALREGINTDQVIQFLVERGTRIYEVAPQDETLEQFYLRLMNATSGAKVVT
jgi:ABC-2 type transport system ATP-binding protein